MSTTSIDVRLELDGWALFWARLEATAGHGDELAALRTDVAATARDTLDPKGLASHPAVAAMRRLFRAAGCDPTRHRPSSEALLRRILKGGELPPIHAFVDLNNCLSARMVVPCCVMAEGSFSPVVTLRAGKEGESLDSMRGEFNLAGKPLLEDARGPFGTPITDSHRVMVQADTEVAWLVAYLPRGVVEAGEVAEALRMLIDVAPVARAEVIPAAAVD